MWIWIIYIYTLQHYKATNLLHLLKKMTEWMNECDLKLCYYQGKTFKKLQETTAGNPLFERFENNMNGIKANQYHYFETNNDQQSKAIIIECRRLRAQISNK